MYLEHYKLREYPFTLASDPRFFYFSEGHREAMAGLLYAWRERKGLALLLGEPGTGKTTVLTAVLGMMDGGINAQTLDSPLHATPEQVLAAIIEGYGLAAAGNELSRLLAQLRAHLLERYQQGQCMLLVVDEAQDLNPAALEQIRLLTNLEISGHKLLQIVLSGQLELAAHLRTIAGQALQQRVAVRCQLAALGVQEAHAYLAARLEVAGGRGEIFEPAAAQRLHQLAQGVPRVMNVVADHCLLAGFAARTPRVTRALVDRVGFQLEMGPPPASDRAAARPAAAPAPAEGNNGGWPTALARFASGCARWAGLATAK